VRNKKLGKNSFYTPAEKCFALNLKYHSSSAYSVVRKTFENDMLHPSSLNRWYQNIDESPGFTAESKVILKRKIIEAKAASKKGAGALTVDEMSVRKHLTNDKHQDKYIGVVNFVKKPKSVPELASKAIVFMITSVNENWKIPIGYFYVNGLSALKRTALIKS
jgi:KaiC/GvpD/RAD55 family RecA-like ATPase